MNTESTEKAVVREEPTTNRKVCLKQLFVSVVCSKVCLKQLFVSVVCSKVCVKKSLRIQWGNQTPQVKEGQTIQWPEKRTTSQTMIYKTLHRKLQIGQYEHH